MIMVVPSSMDSGVARALEMLSRRLKFGEETGVEEKGDVEKVDKKEIETQILDKDTKDDGSEKASSNKGAA